MLDVACDDLYFDIATLEGDALALEIYRNYKPGKAFWITETGSGALAATKVPAGGQLRAWAFSALARGCEAYNFFRWRTCLSGQEQELQGVVEYSGKPRRRYAAVQALYGELEALWPRFADLPLPRAEVAIINDYDASWGYNNSRVEIRYDHQVLAMYRACFDHNVAADVLPPERDLAGYKVVLLPSLLMVDEEFAARLRAFVQAGGTVVSLPQLATRDRNDNYLPACAPVGLTELCGLRVEGGMYLRNYNGPEQALWVPQASYADETPAVSVTLPGGDVHGVSRIWMEDLELEGGTALGTFTDNDFAGSPFLVEKRTGNGRTLYCAAYPSPEVLDPDHRRRAHRCRRTPRPADPALCGSPAPRRLYLRHQPSRRAGARTARRRRSHPRRLPRRPRPPRRVRCVPAAAGGSEGLAIIFTTKSRRHKGTIIISLCVFVSS